MTDQLRKALNAFIKICKLPPETENWHILRQTLKYRLFTQQAVMKMSVSNDITQTL